MRVHLYIRPEHRSVEHIVAGFQKHGIQTHLKHTAEKCDLAVIWGFRNAWTPKEGTYRRLLVFERGYLPNRRTWPSVGYDGLNGYADFCNDAVPKDRWERIFSKYLQPWREPHGSYVLVAGQVPGDANLRGLDSHKWCLDVAQRISAFGQPVAIRWHPKSDAKPPSTKFRVLPPMRFQEALRETRYLVVYNSNAAVDAVLAGVPTVTMDQGSMAYEVTGHDPTAIPPMPDRADWGRRLAYTQWSMDGRGTKVDEVANGAFWEHLSKGLA